jgi:hypothetical protein
VNLFEGFSDRQIALAILGKVQNTALVSELSATANVHGVKCLHTLHGATEITKLMELRHLYALDELKGEQLEAVYLAGEAQRRLDAAPFQSLVNAINELGK